MSASVNQNLFELISQEFLTYAEVLDINRSWKGHTRDVTAKPVHRVVLWSAIMDRAPMERTDFERRVLGQLAGAVA
jgi:hypothetical protein